MSDKDTAVAEELQNMGITEEQLQDPEQVKELAEKLEAEDKAAAEDVETSEKDVDTEKQEELLNNQLARLSKLVVKRLDKKAQNKTSDEPKLTEIDVDNRVYIKSNQLSDEKVKVLQEFAQLPSNQGKTFEEIANSTAVKAEFTRIDKESAVTEELDSNADEDVILQTKSNIYEQHKADGKEPKTEYEKKVVAEKGLEEMGFQEY